MRVVSIDSCTTAVEEPGTPENTMSVFPNPASGLFTVTTIAPITTADITLTDITGRILCIRHLENKVINEDFDVHSLPQGTYILQIYIDGNIATRKIAVY
jgi:hypothetical protein